MSELHRPWIILCTKYNLSTCNLSLNTQVISNKPRASHSSSCHTSFMVIYAKYFFFNNQYFGKNYINDMNYIIFNYIRLSSGSIVSSWYRVFDFRSFVCLSFNVFYNGVIMLSKSLFFVLELESVPVYIIFRTSSSGFLKWYL